MSRIFGSLALGAGLLFSGLAQAKPVPVDHYSRMPAFYDAALSPDGKFMATIQDSGGQYILRVYNLADPSDKKLRATKYGKDLRVNRIDWANNDTILVNVSIPSKFRNQIIQTGYIYVVDKDVTGAEVLLKPEARGDLGSRMSKTTGFRQFNNRVIDELPDDPNHILMSYGVEDQSKPGVHKMNINTRRAELVKNGNLTTQHWITDRNHQLRVGAGRRDRNGEWTLVIRDAVGDTWRPASDYPGLSADTSVYGFTENPNELIIGDYKDKNTLGLYVYNLAQKRQTRKLLHNDKYDAEGIILSADGKKVVGASFLADSREKVYFDAAYKAAQAPIEAKFSGFQISYYDRTPDNKKFLFKASAPNLPPMMYFYNANTSQFKPIGEDYPEIGTTPQGDVTKVSYKTRDGYKIGGYLTTPPAIGEGRVALKNLPFIVMPHGGPYSRDTMSYDFLAQFMASRGYAVLQMNFRGSDGLGFQHKQAGRKNWEVMQEDVEDGTRWLIEKGYADPSRVCIVGWSYGGYAALIGSIKNPDLYKCAVSIAGVTDLNDMVSDLKKNRFGKFSARDFMLKGFEGGDNIKENSPVKRADELMTPTLLVHGTKDIQVQFDQYKRMKRAMKKSPAKTSFIEIKDGDHSLATSQHRKTLFVAMDKHLKTYLGESEAAP